MEMMKNRNIMRRILDEEVIYYPVDINQYTDNTYRITMPDFPELAVCGIGVSFTIEQTSKALDEAIYARIENKDYIPAPSNGNLRIAVPLETLRVIWEYLV